MSAHLERVRIVQLYHSVTFGDDRYESARPMCVVTGVQDDSVRVSREVIKEDLVNLVNVLKFTEVVKDSKA
jgi:hypothetical protein